MTEGLVYVAPDRVVLAAGTAKRTITHAHRVEISPNRSDIAALPNALGDAIRHLLAERRMRRGARVAVHLDDALVHPFHTVPVPPLITPREIGDWTADQMERVTGQAIAKTRLRAGCPTPSGVLGYAISDELVDAIEHACASTGLALSELVPVSANRIPRGFGWRAAGVVVSSSHSDTLIGSDGAASVAVRRIRRSAQAERAPDAADQSHAVEHASQAVLPTREWAKLELLRRGLSLSESLLRYVDV